MRLVALGALALTLGVAGCSVQDASTAPVTVKADIPAAGLQHLVFQGTTGETSIGVSPDDAVHVKLVLQQEERRIMGASIGSEPTLRDIEGAKLGQDHKGDVLTLSATYPSGDTHDSDVKAKWVVQVPMRFSVDVSMKAGRAVIEGMAGGVKAQLGAGEVVIHVPSGPVNGLLSAGRLHVISDTTQPGTLLLRSTFGLAALSFNGKLYAPPPSAFHFFGNSERQQAGGKDDMDLKVTAGEVDLRVGTLGDYKDYSGLFDDYK